MSSHDVNFDEWEGDMKSRVYWNCLMNETILVQELHLPPSGLARLEEFVPIPKFIPFETAGFVSASLFSLSGDIDDSFFPYHFLASRTKEKSFSYRINREGGGGKEKEEQKSI